MLTKGSSIRLPNPPQMKNKGKNYVISLRWGRDGWMARGGGGGGSE